MAIDSQVVEEGINEALLSLAAIEHGSEGDLSVGSAGARSRILRVLVVTSSAASALTLGPVGVDGLIVLVALAVDDLAIGSP